MLQVERILHHLLDTVKRTFRRVAVSFASVFVAAIAVVEGTGFALTGHFGEGLVHLVAVVIGFSLALNVALAIAIEEGLRGFLALIKDVAVATEKAVEGGVKLAEHELGDLAHSAGHLAQNAEHSVATVLKRAEQLPGQATGAIEGAVQGIERRFGGGGQEPPSS